MTFRPVAPRMVLALTLSVTALGGVTHAGDDVPFKAKLAYDPETTVVGVRVDESGRVIVGQWVTGSGRGTHIGKSTISVYQEFAVDRFGVLSFWDEFTITAANGDLLYGTSEGTLDLLTGVLDDAYVLTGGTGRFAGATGGGTAAGYLDFDTGVVHQTIQGTISRPR